MIFEPIKNTMWKAEVERILKEENEMIEYAVEEMLQRGHGGVKITRSKTGFISSVRLDDDVPYGEIHMTCE